MIPLFSSNLSAEMVKLQVKLMHIAKLAEVETTATADEAAYGDKAHVGYAMSKHVIELALAEDPTIGERPAHIAFTSTLTAQHVSHTGAAILAKNVLSDHEIYRAPGWKQILGKVAKTLKNGDTDFIKATLMDIVFWSSQSTSGRFNAEYQRYDRYAVRSIAEWCTPSWHGPIGKAPSASRMTFMRLKDKLIAEGLIEAKSAVWDGQTALWVRATDKLNDIVFVPGYWNSLQPKPKPEKAEASPKKLRPRGQSAVIAALQEKQEDLYRRVRDGEFKWKTREERQEIFLALTAPQPISAKRSKAAYAPPGSWKIEKIRERLEPDLQDGNHWL